VFVATHLADPRFFLWLSRCPTSSHSPYTLPSSVCPKSCICHSCETAGCVPTIPIPELPTLLPALTNLDAGVGRSFRTVHRACPSFSGQFHSSLSPLAATPMDSPQGVANKRLTTKLSPLDATLMKNRGRGPVIVTRFSESSRNAINTPLGRLLFQLRQYPP